MMNLCTCSKGTKNIIDSKFGIILSSLVLAGFLIILSIVDWFISLGCVFLLLVAYEWLRYSALSKGHTGRCASRQAILRILDVGSFF